MIYIYSICKIEKLNYLLYPLVGIHILYYSSIIIESCDKIVSYHWIIYDAII